MKYYVNVKSRNTAFSPAQMLAVVELASKHSHLSADATEDALVFTFVSELSAIDFQFAAVNTPALRVHAFTETF